MLKRDRTWDKMHNIENYRRCHQSPCRILCRHGEGALGQRKGGRGAAQTADGTAPSSACEGRTSLLRVGKAKSYKTLLVPTEALRRLHRGRQRSRAWPFMRDVPGGG